MKKSNITGWKDVFTFTLIQTLKSKAFIISYVIFIVLAMVSMPIISRITSGGRSDMNALSPVKKVYVNNETTLPNMDFREILKDQRMSNIAFETMQEDYNVVASRIEEKERESIILTISENEGNYSLNFVKSSNGPINDSSLQLLADSIAPQFEIYKINTLGIANKQLAIIHASVTTKVSIADAKWY